MGDDVDGGDRHQRVHEGHSAAGPPRAAADRAGALHPEPVEAGDEEHARRRARSCRRGRARSRRAKPIEVKRSCSAGPIGPTASPWLSPSNVTVPIITITKATVPGAVIEPRQAAERRAQADHAVARLEHADAREQVEVDRERLAAPRPGLDAPHRLGGERDDRVADDRRDQRRRRVGPPADQLDPGEHQQPERGGPAAEPLRVGTARRRAAADERARRAADRPPRVEGAEDVSEQDRQDDEADPEGDHDEGRREVVGGRVGPDVAGHDHDHQQQRRRSRRRGSRPRGCRAGGRDRAAAAATAGSRAAASATAAPAPRTRPRAPPRRPTRSRSRRSAAGCAGSGRRVRHRRRTPARRGDQERDAAHG